jgi:two-component system, chemotaxis family, chemotaxis protein CheY
MDDPFFLVDLEKYGTSGPYGAAAEHASRDEKRFFTYPRMNTARILREEITMKCLIADDDSFGRELLACFLADHAETIDTAKNGIEAVELFGAALEEGDPYEFVCLDILMPKMDGQEALLRMRQLENEAGLAGNEAAIIVMTTALSSVQDIQKAIWQGDCNNYLVKPIAQADLVAILNSYHLID